MDGSQVKQYDLGQSLDTGLSLWEHIDIPDRQLHFFAAKRWLTFCFLVCEDLARQDPVTKLVRAVGPDLVIALLMDGPQISQRWPARYAAVLAEDPGCSVLTLTNLGMVDRSRRNGPQAPSHACPNCKHSWTEPEKKSRAVALWRDRTQGNVEIELEAGAEAIVLTLTRKKETEYSVDGRRHVDAAHLVLDTKASNHILQIHLANREALL
jgi:hypothetical protein